VQATTKPDRITHDEAVDYGLRPIQQMGSFRANETQAESVFGSRATFV
jgi:hypothetical protein